MTRMLAAALCAVAMSAAPAADPEVSRFFGRYEGVAVSSGIDEIEARDLTVEIRPHGPRGFSVAWTTVIRKADGRLKRSAEKVNFEPAKQSGIYGSAMRRNMFGHEVPLDPLQGEPFVWATVAGDSLTVHSLLVTESGGYEMQSHVRSLFEDGMLIEFRRVRDGIALRTVTGELARKR